MLLVGMLALFLMLPPFSPASASSCLLASGFAVCPWPSSWGLCPLGAPGTVRANLAVCVCGGFCEDMPERQRLACVPPAPEPFASSGFNAGSPALRFASWLTILVCRSPSLVFAPARDGPLWGYVYRGPFVICN